MGRGRIRRGLGNGLGLVDEVEAEAMGGVGGEIDKEAVLGDVQYETKEGVDGKGLAASKSEGVFGSGWRGIETRWGGGLVDGGGGAEDIGSAVGGEVSKDMSYGNRISEVL